MHDERAPGVVDRISRFFFQPRSARSVVLWLSLYLAATANWPLWGAILHDGESARAQWTSLAAMAWLVFFGTAALLSFTAWTRWMKPLWMVIILVAAMAQYYMGAYGVVMDPSMVLNVVQTDVHEARDVMNWRLVASVLVVCVPVALWLWRVNLRPERWWRQLGRNALLLLACVAMIGVGVAASARTLAPLMRNHVQLRYMMNPLASLYSAGKVAVQPLLKHQTQLVRITDGSALGASYAAQHKPPLFVLVVGETARADHFSLNGYARNTTPALAARGVMSFRNVHSCGTNTIASVPCMFSSLGKRGFESRSSEYENLLDVLQAAGLAVLWLDNQAGCKGVCERVAHAQANDAASAAVAPGLCKEGECLDEVLLTGIDERLAALAPERVARGVVLVMHQMGSHGPAYYKRAAPADKHFLPECQTNNLADCKPQELINAYDNSIVATDQFLGHAIDWLQRRADRFDTAMLYLSDHGESLGEYGMFLHGMPYSIAPEVQKHVPMVLWFGSQWAEHRPVGRGCIESRLDAQLTHDNLYHTVLGLMDVRSPTYSAQLDALASCRAGAVARVDAATL